jgi:hypothetical protein
MDLVDQRAIISVQTLQHALGCHNLILAEIVQCPLQGFRKIGAAFVTTCKEEF